MELRFLPDNMRCLRLPYNHIADINNTDTSENSTNLSQYS